MENYYEVLNFLIDVNLDKLGTLAQLVRAANLDRVGYLETNN